MVKCLSLALHHLVIFCHHTGVITCLTYVMVQSMDELVLVLVLALSTNYQLRSTNY